MNNKYRRLLKRGSLLMMLVLALFVLSSCYTEPDKVIDNGIQNTGSQNFTDILTPTPAITATPVPTVPPTTAPTASTVDWSNWDFGNDTATNPPANVTPVPTAPPIGSSTVTAAPSVTGTSQTSSVKATATPKPTTNVKTTATPQPSTTLKRGDTGAAVKRLQQALKNLGYLTGSADGTYGAATETAVKEFQAANGLTADGKAGARTQQVLYSGKAKKKTASSSTSSTTSSSSTDKVANTYVTGYSYSKARTDVYLQLGSTGTQVKNLQNRLIDLGYLTGTADGNFAETTQAAVKAFQKRNSLYADGKAGPDTLTKLYSSSAKRAESVAGTLGSLKEGMDGTAVRTLQKNLKTLGYYSGSVDGSYGAGTTAAVKKFQSAHGLNADGVAGKSTLNAIASAIAGGSSGSSSGSAAAPANYGKTAKSNGYSTVSASSGSSSNVKALQSALSSRGYYSGSVSGTYGTSTESAVSAYQRANGLRVTGMAGPSTQRLLYGGTSESGSYKKLTPGSTGSEVKTMQYALYELKYYDGNITGTYDAATESAVMAFQECNGLSIDGIAGQSTLRRLYSSNAIPCSL